MPDVVLKMKGTAVKTQIEYVRVKFGDDGYRKWVDALSEDARNIVDETVLESRWYEGECAVVELRSKICDVFYDGDPRGAWELGRYSAERGLKGVYKVFLRVGSPNWIADRASQVFDRYFRPGETKTMVNEKNLAVAHIIGFPERTGLVEQTVAGFMEMALELSGAKNVNVSISKSYSRGDGLTEFRNTWG